MITPYIVQVTPYILDRWWPVIEPALENMEHVFNTTPEGRPVLEIEEKINAGIATPWIGLEHHEGEDEPRLVAGMITVVSRDPLTAGKHLLIYALWSFQGMSREMLEYGAKTILQHAQEQNCPQVLAFVLDERMKKYVRRTKFFDNEASFFIANVEGLPWVEEAVDLGRLIGPGT